MAWWYYEETTIYRPKKKEEDPGTGAMILGVVFWLVVIALILKAFN